MDKNLKNLLLSLDLNEIEIDDLENIEPMFIGLTIEEFVENCKVMIDFGYPECDLDVLILSNPNIFVRPKESLIISLTELSKTCDDIESALKDNPYII